jgi:hypothetical protein
MAATNGPLTVHPTNGRYFRDASGAPVFLQGPNSHYNIQDGGATDPPPGMRGGVSDTDWAAVLAEMVSNGNNLTRLWAWESPKGQMFGTDTWFIQPMQWPRTGPGNAADGKLKFDCSDALDSTYLARLRDRAIDCRDAGIYCQVFFFQWFSIGGTGTTHVWINHPYNPTNNINSIDGDTNNDNIGQECYENSIAAVRTAQDSLIVQIVEHLNDLDNIIWEVGNEINNGTTFGRAGVGRPRHCADPLDRGRTGAPAPHSRLPLPAGHWEHGRQRHDRRAGDGGVLANRPGRDRPGRGRGLGRGCVERDDGRQSAREYRGAGDHRRYRSHERAGAGAGEPDRLLLEEHDAGAQPRHVRQPVGDGVAPADAVADRAGVHRRLRGPLR